MEKIVHFQFDEIEFADAIVLLTYAVINRMISKNYSEQFNRYITSPKFVLRVSKAVAARNLGAGEVAFRVTQKTEVRDLSTQEVGEVLGETLVFLLDQKIDKDDFSRQGYLERSRKYSLETTLVDYLDQLTNLFFAKKGFSNQLKATVLAKMRQETKEGS